MKISRFILITTALVAFTFAPSAPSRAATLLGSGTFNVAGDLTRIDDGGNALEFLDLSVTVGQSEAAALAAYGSAGFTLATAGQVAALFDAFGIVYNFVPNSYVELGASVSASTNLVNYLGVTSAPNGTLGHFDTSGSTGNARSYFCIAHCNPSTGFVNNLNLAPNVSIGITLVRNSVEATPIPAALPLFASGLGGLGLLGWRRKRKAISPLWLHTSPTSRDATCRASKMTL